MPLSVTITSAGIVAPSYDDILASLEETYRSIYGADVVLDSSTQDGQLLGVFAEAINEVNSACIQAYNSFSPLYAAGNALSANVLINGIQRKAGSHSTVDLLLTGSPGTTLNQCTAQDISNQVWTIPDGTIIGADGTATITATCVQEGQVTAGAGTVTILGTPILGWESVTNQTAASPGSSTETDAQLRQRQVLSVSLPSQGLLEGMEGNLAQLDGVSKVSVFQNSTSQAANGIEPHNIAVVIEGGQATEIAQVIYNTKSLGVSMQGNTTETIKGNVISFYRPEPVTITANISVSAMEGYVDSFGVQIQKNVSAAISATPIGGTIYLSRLYKNADLDPVDGGDTYSISSFTLMREGQAAPIVGDISLAFYEESVCNPEDVVLTVRDSVH